MSDDDLLDLAFLVGIDAVHGSELDDVYRRVDAAPAEVRTEFHRQVRAAREVMATVSGATTQPPPETLRELVIETARTDVDTGARPVLATSTIATARHRRRSRLMYAAAAAAVAVVVGVVGWAIGSSSNGSTREQPTAEQVFAAKDVRTSSGAVASGHATVTFSPSADAGVLVMNDVPPPKTGTVYQMWLSRPSGMTSVGTMTDKDVAPSTTAVIKGLDGATALAFTVEPPGGSKSPTGPVVAQLPLS